MAPVRLIINIELPNQRAYEVAWAIAKLRGFETLDQFFEEAAIDAIEMVVDCRGSPEISEVNWGFKTREKLENEEKKKSEAEAEIKI